MSINKIIKDVLIEWHDWVIDGAPTLGQFSRHEGLCGTINHAMVRAAANGDLSESKAEAVVEAFMNFMTAMIMDPNREACSGASPFCEPRTYYHEVQLARCHLNAKRIDFVRDVIAGEIDFEAGYGK